MDDSDAKLVKEVYALPSSCGQKCWRPHIAQSQLELSFGSVQRRGIWCRNIEKYLHNIFDNERHCTPAAVIFAGNLAYLGFE